ncbi:LysM peptidoglycan-binding domain-containing protein [Streptacidiphilus neutrinimicus]|uniref:LysM peptidoglycan-binding domain-containing protein n=1 Tax=Streptacidiphilus neutrinimicus TaxID=105420 RepID=UPI0005A77C15|nr:LysM peptidoglycan-binding domain-containing protein [Streptacidiphilus neutrinimicus]
MGSRPLPRLLKGLGALGALAVLEVGVPLTLLAWGTNPHHVPSWQQTTDALTGPDNGSLFLGAITVLGWFAWTLFTVQVLLELVAVLRHRAAPRLPVLGAGQHLAATLVAAVVLLLPTTGTALAEAAPASAATLHLPHHATPSPQQAAAAVAAETATGWQGPVHHVTSGDETMWGLAEHYLGDGTRWKDIAALNEGIVQSDGQSVTASTLHLMPGWTLRLPADAKPQEPAPSTHRVSEAAAMHHGGGHAAQQQEDTEHAGVSHEKVHIVQPGETLSGIAEQDLGNADDYPAIYQASRDIEQSDGRQLTDPDLILPGWRLDIPQPTPASTPAPETPSPAPAPHVDGSHGSRSPSPAPTAPSSAPTSTTAAPTTAPGPAPSPAGAPPGVSPTQAPSTPATPAASDTPTATASSAPPAAGSPAAPSAVAVAPAASDSADSGSELQLGAAIAALLAAGLTGGYGIKRSLQQRSRRPGETIAVPAEASSLEQILANQADTPTAELLDLALRTMATQLPEGERLPVLEAARISRSGIHLQADGPLSAPFVQGEDGWWNLDPGADLLDGAAAAEIPAPYPMLATLGAEPDGTLLLVNLATVQTLLLDGSPEQVREVARGLALEAATSPWGQELQVLTAGVVDAGLPAMMATGRVRRLDQIGHAVTDLADLLLTVHQDPDASMPWMLVASDDVDQETAWELAGLISRSPSAPVALALPAHGLDPLFPDALRLDCSTGDPQLVPHGRAPVELQRVTQAEYDILTQDLRTTEQPANPPTGAWTHVAEDTWDLAEPAPDTLASSDETEEADGSETEAGGDPARPVSSFLAFARPVRDTGRLAVSVPVLPAKPVALALPDPTSHASQGDEVAQDSDEAANMPAQPAMSSECADLHAPEIRVLGPVDVTGLGSSGRGKRLAEVAAYILLRPSHTRTDLAYAMNPITPWGERSVKQRLHDLRSLLENTPDGNPRLARNSRDGALPALTGVRCDWHKFRKLAERGLLAGPAGVDDLEAALALVRARPFAGSTAAWSMPDQQEMVSRIVDVAHTIARYRTATGHYTQARAAIAKGVDVEPAAEMLYRDWITLEAVCGSRAEVQRVISRLQGELRALDVEMEHATQELIERVYAQLLKGSA